MATVRLKCYAPQLGNLKLWTRWLSLAAASVCFGWVGLERLEQYRYQAEARAEFERLEQPAPLAAHSLTQPAPAFARLEIPRLKVSGYVEDGFDARTLSRAIGRNPRGARLGGRGNLILAAHRDTFFAGLEGVKRGDIVSVQAAGGSLVQYRVSQILVVGQSDTWVMNSDPKRNMLTLITCYPFHFVGNAPNRLVVQAIPVSPASSSRL